MLKHTKSEVDLQKGWKPYRVVLKGSKLYLHKLPGDLTNTAKQLFPTTIIAPISTLMDLPTVTKILDKKPKRAYWGTGASHHPDLIVGEKGKEKETSVKGGTLEALLHELIFASSFLVEDGEDKSSYNEFLKTLLLIWPFLPFSTSQSASELDRFSGLAVRTALESINRDPECSINQSTKALIKRLEKILETICSNYPEDLKTSTGNASDWKSALGEVVKQLENLSVEESSRASLLLEKSFAQLIPSQSIPPTEWTSSRPTYSRAGSSSSASSSPSKPRKHTTNTLDQELPPSMTASSFLNYDSINFAAQINLFHLDRLNSISGQTSTTSRHILRTASTILQGSKQNPITSLFSFSPSRPHFLSRMVLETIFDYSNMLPPNHNFTSISGIEMRALVISKWIKIGTESRSRGDVSSWMAIAFALCCRAIARLEETWRIIEEQQVDLVRREWAPVLAEVGYVDFEQGSISPLRGGINRIGGIPYFGSIIESAVDTLRSTKTSPSNENPGAVDLVPFYQLKTKLDHLDSIWSQDGQVQAPLDIVPNGDLQYLFQILSRQLPTPGSQLRSYLVNSLEAEPRFAGTYPSLFGKLRSSMEPSPLLPLIMVEPLPYISLIDREKVIALAARSLPRKQSNSAMSSGTSSSIPAKKSFTNLSTGTITPDQQRPLAIRHNSYPPSITPSTERLGFAKALRSEIANPSDTLLRFAEGDLVFRIISTALPIVPTQVDISTTATKKGLLSRTSSWIESKSSRGTPKNGSIHESIGIGSPLSRRGSRAFSTHSVEPTSARLQVASESEPVSVVVKAGTIDNLLDILIFGIDKLRTPTIDANGEISLTSGGGRPISLDVEEFRSCFFATYRSFSTPLALLDMLRKRYLAALNASQDYLTLSASKPFPNWSLSPTFSSSSVVVEENKSDLDWDQISIVRSTVLDNLRYWFENHLSDFLDDDDLYSSTHAFFLSVELIEETNSIERTTQDDSLLEEVKSLKQRFYRKCLRPLVRSRKAVTVGGEGLVTRSGPIENDLSYDLLSVTDLVDKLDRMACTITQDVTGMLAGFPR